MTTTRTLTPKATKDSSRTQGLALLKEKAKIASNTVAGIVTEIASPPRTLAMIDFCMLRSGFGATKEAQRCGESVEAYGNTRFVQNLRRSGDTCEGQPVWSCARCSERW